MDLIAVAQNDMQRISQAEFSTSAVFLSADSLETATVRVIATSHHLKFDPDTGVMAISRNVHISVSEQVLIAEGYTTRNANGIVDLVGHRVTWADSTGADKTYLISETMPDDTLGLIVLTLEDYNGG